MNPRELEVDDGVSPIQDAILTPPGSQTTLRLTLLPRSWAVLTPLLPCLPAIPLVEPGPPQRAVDHRWAQVVTSRD